MKSPRAARVRQLLLSIAALGGVAATLIGPPTAGFGATRTRDATSTTPAVGSDLYHLDRITAHYTQADSGQIHLELYDRPVGFPTLQTGWRASDTRLGLATATGPITPTLLPFDVRLAQDSSNPTLASLTSGGATLGLGLASVDNAPPAPVTGLVGGNTVTYPNIAPSSVGATGSVSSVAPLSATIDLSLHTTLSGVDASVVLPSADAAGPIVFTLALGPGEQLVQEPGGAIQVTRAMTTYSDAGVPFVAHDPAYVVEIPRAVDSAADPVASARPGSVAMAMTPGSAGGQDVTLSIDPAWLHDPARVFPVRLDLPIATANAAAHTGLLGTVNSCMPDTPAPQDQIVVGVADGCTYHGLLHFDVSGLRYHTQVVSATLTLYTPYQTGPTGVVIYPNAPASDLPLGQEPSWTTAPAVMTGSIGIAQSASDGPWQSWDITSLVQQWIRNGKANGGLTLVGTGAPVVFASPMATTGAVPPIIPLVCSLLPAPPNGPVQCAQPTVPPAPTVPPVPSVPPTPTPAQQCQVVGYAGVDAAACVPSPSWACAGASVGSTSGVAACAPGCAYVVAGNTLLESACTPPCAASVAAHVHDPDPCLLPLMPFVDDVHQVGLVPHLEMVYADVAYERSQSTHLIPPIYTNSFGDPPPPFNDGAGTIFGAAATNMPDGNCDGDPASCGEMSAVSQNLGGSNARISPIRLECGVDQPGYSWWNGGNGVPAYDAMQSAYNDGLTPIVDFTVDDSCASPYGGAFNVNWYSEMQDFVSNMPFSLGRFTYFEIGNEQNAGHMYYDTFVGNFGAAAYALQAALGQSGNYRVIVGAMLKPTAYPSCPDFSGDPNRPDIQVASDAIHQAEAQGVTDQHLGVAVHPYGYDSGEWYDGYWQNYYAWKNNLPGGGDPDGNAPGDMCYDLGAMIDLWTSTDYFPPDTPVLFTEDNIEVGQYDGGNNPNDLNTPQGWNEEGGYLIDLATWMHDQGDDYAPYSPIRISWFRLKDTGSDFYGIYTSGSTGYEKNVQEFYCNDPNIGGPNSPSYPMSSDYRRLITNYEACY